MIVAPVDEPVQHCDGVHRRCVGQGLQAQHGRAWCVARQRVRRTFLAQREVRARVSPVPTDMPPATGRDSGRSGPRALVCFRWSHMSTSRRRSSRDTRARSPSGHTWMARAAIGPIRVSLTATHSECHSKGLIHGRAIGASHARLVRRWVSRLATTVAGAVSSADSPDAVALPIEQQEVAATVTAVANHKKLAQHRPSSIFHWLSQPG